jgi:hypothetical protein
VKDAMKNSSTKHLIYALCAITVVIVVFLILIVAKGTKTTATSTTTTTAAAGNTTGSTPAPATITADLTAVQQSTLDTIGTGTVLAKPTAITAPSITQNNKPEILYEGAEFCPYCATERWPMAVALSKFGSFTSLRVTHSSSTDVYPNTQTLSFYESTYRSNYLNFEPIEIETNIPNGDGYTMLQTPTVAENKIVNTYDATPYLSSDEAGSIPFIDFGGHYLIAGATYSPTVLQGKSAASIAGSLNTPSSSVAKGVDGTANTMIATICKLTSNQPATVCDSTIQKIESQL